MTWYDLLNNIQRGNPVSILSAKFNKYLRTLPSVFVRPVST